MTEKSKATIPISEFKATCLAVLERVRRTGTSIVVTRHGEPMAEIVPPSSGVTGHAWLGCMAGTATFNDDLIAPVSEQDEWDVLRP
jgi:prevent-host-death family protein